MRRTLALGLTTLTLLFAGVTAAHVADRPGHHLAGGFEWSAPRR
jgi:hypothetical protein